MPILPLFSQISGDGSNTIDDIHDIVVSSDTLETVLSSDTSVTQITSDTLKTTVE